MVKKDSKKESQLGFLYDKYIERAKTQGKRYLNSPEDLSYQWIDFFKFYHVDEEEILFKMQKIAREQLKKSGINYYDFSRSSDPKVKYFYIRNF